MIDQILKSAGFIKDKTYKETRFLKVPSETFCVFLDSAEAWGSDHENRLVRHSTSIELYSERVDKAAEKRIESTLNELGIEWSRTDRMWIPEDQFFEVVYDFEWIEKL